MATSVCLATAGCVDDEADSSLDADYDDTDLKDDDGNEYTLHKNEDGTETARYKDGREVTFRRDENNDLNYVSGAAGLLGGLAAGYFLFHGLKGGGGGYVYGGAYHPSSSISRMDRRERDRRISNFTPSGKAPSSTPKVSSGSSKSSSVSSGGSKGGFGSAGARSSAAS